MRKIILFVSLVCLTIWSVEANNLPKDSTLQSNSKTEKLKGLDINIDMEALGKELDEAMKNIDIEMPNIENIVAEINNSTAYLNDGQEKNIFINTSSNQTGKIPSRTEKKIFTNISEIEIDQKYGDIIIRESNSKQVDLEIQYFDQGSKKATCDVSTSKGILFVATNLEGIRGRNGVKINYILSIPRNTGLTVNLTYGNMKMDNHRGSLLANMSYSDLDIQSLMGVKPDIKMRYGNVNINSASDISLVSAYSKIKIGKVNNLEISGDYTDYVLNDVQSLLANKKIAYSHFKIGTISKMSMTLEYGDINIKNLVSDLTTKCSYSNLNIGNASGNLDRILVNASYSDVTVILPEGMAANFAVDLRYGDLSISKKHSVTYTENFESNNTNRKSGRIGTKTPRAKIEVSNSYADVRIR